MSNERRRVVLSDYRQRKIDEGAVDVELADGTTLTVPPPHVWPDDVVKKARAGDLEGSGIALLGEEDYARWCASGGNGSLLASLMGDEFNLDVGESEASSSSSTSTGRPSKRT